MGSRSVTHLRSHRRTVATTVAGNFVEYFDWLAFGLYAPLFAAQFFPAADPAGSLLSTFAVFAAGMLFRPLGGVLLGRLADRRGRKPALVLSIILMGGGSTLIGLSPTYAQIGLAAPLVLLLGRAAQGLSAGGEWPAAVTYLMELSPPNRRCFYGSLFAMSAAAGAFVASLLGGALSSVLGASAMSGWGWRVPFLLGGVFGVVLLLLRGKITETAVFEESVRSRGSRGSLRALLVEHRRSVGLVAVVVAGTTMVSGTWTAVVPAMAARVSDSGTMFWAVVLVTGVVTPLQVPLGALADRVGVRPVLTAFVLAFAVVGPIAYLGLSPNFLVLVLAYGSGILFIAGLTAVLPKVLAAMYPPEVRAVGIGVPHSVTTAVFGGLTPMLATYMAAHGASGWYIAIVVVAVLLAWAAAMDAARRFVRAPATDLSTPDDGRPPVAAAA
ncbi:MFS transporter [Actinokineospora auranticolor]|uniref:MHS family alpha-ketoglutarate permease-like MFS transporter n=1 Tax=Actinokineospora auranticolor TaxID=155976 RepID=A0A2S6GDB0_9PSEU|nr:MFS transporter [Actinokineospora auranticolor]PPK63170.1 MHS family alpha-ketoglutarate permease-like MFS transporter [Actinokineospora auranticolor]